MVETSDTARVGSPCISVCLLNEEDICCGCYRSAEEIRSWLMMLDPERKQVLARATERSKQGNPFAGD
ncbi:MAG: DUF1289 domain-containing protein [Gammaproteobacteria bacterium]|nr:MAG: DUF1289 domain-containing protein [Gammaproteobacteria bacterium]RLA54820.1 MAG: DUF1289 domain-containing protein [Gammaproteobacteria bacterium]